MLYLVRSGPVLLGSELPRSLVLRLRDPMTGSSMYWTLRFYWMKNLISSCVILGTRYLPERRQMTSQITLVREGPESQMAGLPGWAAQHEVPPGPPGRPAFPWWALKHEGACVNGGGEVRQGDFRYRAKLRQKYSQLLGLGA